MPISVFCALCHREAVATVEGIHYFQLVASLKQELLYMLIFHINPPPTAFTNWKPFQWMQCAVGLF